MDLHIFKGLAIKGLLPALHLHRKNLAGILDISTIQKEMPELIQGDPLLQKIVLDTMASKIPAGYKIIICNSEDIGIVELIAKRENLTVVVKTNDHYEYPNGDLYLDYTKSPGRHIEALMYKTVLHTIEDLFGDIDSVSKYFKVEHIICCIDYNFPEMVPALGIHGNRRSYSFCYLDSIATAASYLEQITKQTETAILKWRNEHPTKMPKNTHA